ncbi:MAG TPA: glutathione binding-like protein, partial [Anaerolineales bacterium]
ATKRYIDETHRLYGVLNKQLEGKDFITGDYTIADIAAIGWAQGWERQGQDIEDFPNVKAWLARLGARPAVAKGLNVGKDVPSTDLTKDKEAHKVLFNQR